MDIVDESSSMKRRKAAIEQLQTPVKRLKTSINIPVTTTTSSSIHSSSSSPSASTPTFPLIIPDPHAAQDRVRRKKDKQGEHKDPPTPSITTTATGNNSNQNPHHPHSNQFNSNEQNSSFSSSSSSGGCAFSISEDKSGERQFYQIVLQWDPTIPTNTDLNIETSQSSSSSSSSISTNSSSDSSSIDLITSFSSTSDYQSFFRPLLLKDFSAQLLQSYSSNVFQHHSPAAQLHPLTISRCDQREGRGVGEDMYSVELYPVDELGPIDRRKIHKQLKDWVSGDLALIRHHPQNSHSHQQHSHSQKHKGNYRQHHYRPNDVDCYSVCLIDNLEYNKTDDPIAVAYNIRVRIYLPGAGTANSTASSSSSSTTPSSTRIQKLWEVLHPQSTVQPSSSSADDSSNPPKVEYEGQCSLIRLDSPVTTLREFIALLHVDSLCLLPHLLNPSPSSSAVAINRDTNTSSRNTPSPIPAAPSSAPSLSSSLYSIEGEHLEIKRSFEALPERFRSYLERNLNEYQFQSVRVAAYRSKQPGFTLLQGPPGTGKTKTVVALLNSLHLRSFQAHYSSLIDTLLQPPKADVMIGSKGDSPAMPITLNDLISDLTAAPTSPAAHTIRPKPRILVCAPSNAGVDEIISRVLGDNNTLVSSSVSTLSGSGGFVDGNLARYSPDIVRIGQSDMIRDEVKAKISLDVLVDSYMKLSIEQLQQRMRHAAKVKAETERELNSWIKTFKQRYQAAIKDRLQSSTISSTSASLSTTTASMTLPHGEVVEPSFLSGIAHLHERLHLSSLDHHRCESVLSLYSPLPDQPNAFFMRRRERQAAIDRLQLSYLQEAHIVFSTLSGAGLDLLSHLDHPFSALLVDEAAQATELATLVAMRHNVSHVVLIGDPRQLPATVFTNNDCDDRQYMERSLFERLQQAGQHVMALLTQYRMHSEIRSFPSAYFYDGLLQDGENINSPVYRRSYHQHPLFAPFLVLDVHVHNISQACDSVALSKLKQQFPLDQGSKSAGNLIEAAYLIRFLEMLFLLYPNEIHPHQIGIITFYQQQKKLLEEMIKALSQRKPIAATVEVATVDGFQGREKEIILVSCVRHGPSASSSSSSSSSRSIGFVSDIRRMNVALTRGKYGMWIFGDTATLSRGSSGWKQLIQNARERRLIQTLRDVLNVDARFLPVQPNTTFNRTTTNNTWILPGETAVTESAATARNRVVSSPTSSSSSMMTFSPFTSASPTLVHSPPFPHRSQLNDLLHQDLPPLEKI